MQGQDTETDLERGLTNKIGTLVRFSHGCHPFPCPLVMSYDEGSPVAFLPLTGSFIPWPPETSAHGRLLALTHSSPDY